MENRDRLLRVVLSIIPDRSCADDLLQEALLKALGTDREFATSRDALHFLTRVAINTTIDYYRKNGRRRHQFGTTEGQDQCLEAREDQSPYSDPLARLLLRERRRIKGEILTEVREALENIPPRQREAIQLIFGSRNRPLKQLCAERGLAYSTVRSRMLRAVDQIRDHLKNRGYYSDDE